MFRLPSKEKAMPVPKWLGAIALAVAAVVAHPTFTTAEDAGTPRKLRSLGGTLATSPDSTGCALVGEPSGNAAVCYGLVKVAGKPRYTFFLVFKVDPAKVETHGHGIGSKKGSVLVFGPDGGNLPLEVRLGDKKVEFTYTFQVDRKAGTLRESIQIGDKEYSKDVPRVFLVDLTPEKITCRPVKGARPGPAGGPDEVAQALHQLKGKHVEVKAFLAGTKK
jgi:hypothetical protein